MIYLTLSLREECILIRCVSHIVMLEYTESESVIASYIYVLSLSLACVSYYHVCVLYSVCGVVVDLISLVDRWI